MNRNLFYFSASSLISHRYVSNNEVNVSGPIVKEIPAKKLLKIKQQGKSKKTPLEENYLHLLGVIVESCVR